MVIYRPGAVALPSRWRKRKTKYRLPLNMLK
jgi:hypothetical protein